MWVGTALFWIALISVGIFLVVRILPGSGPSGQNAVASGPSDGESAAQVLDRMFATGEIDEPTYRTRRGALSEMRKQR